MLIAEVNDLIKKEWYEKAKNKLDELMKINEPLSIWKGLIYENMKKDIVAAEEYYLMAVERKCECDGIILAYCIRMRKRI